MPDIEPLDNVVILKKTYHPENIIVPFKVGILKKHELCEMRTVCLSHKSVCDLSWSYG